MAEKSGKMAEKSGKNKSAKMAERKVAAVG